MTLRPAGATIAGRAVWLSLLVSSATIYLGARRQSAGPGLLDLAVLGPVLALSILLVVGWWSSSVTVQPDRIVVRDALFRTKSFALEGVSGLEFVQIQPFGLVRFSETFGLVRRFGCVRLKTEVESIWLDPLMQNVRSDGTRPSSTSEMKLLESLSSLVTDEMASEIENTNGQEHLSRLAWLRISAVVGNWISLLVVLYEVQSW